MDQRQVPESLIGKAILLNTGHAPKGTDASDFLPWRAVDTEYGWIVWCNPEDGDDVEEVYHDLAEWFVPIAKLANSLGCWLIEFDCDNESLEGLHEFDWSQG